MSKIFLSWSKSNSLAIAQAFYELIPHIIQNQSVFISAENIRNGEGWFEKITSELKECKTGIIFLTKENLTEEWILFESGGISVTGNAHFILCDLTVSELQKLGSLYKNVNVTELSDIKGLKSLFIDIKNGLGLTQTKDSVIEEAFILYWPKIQQRIKDFRRNNFKELKPTIPDRDFFKTIRGEWDLHYFNIKGKFNYERLKIDEDGKYYGKDPGTGKFVYCFQLNIRDKVGNRISIDKIQLFNRKPSEFIHSTEILEFDEEGMMKGIDTFANRIVYKKIQ
jgi:hypothetical protein